MYEFTAASVYETFPLNVVQSPLDRQPVTDPVAVAHDRIDGVEPMTEIGLDSDSAPDAESDVVATLPSFAGLPDVVVQYDSCPAVSDDEVDTEPVELMVTAPVEPETVTLFPAVMDVTPELVRVMVPPSATVPPPDMPVPGLTVTDELVSDVFGTFETVSVPELLDRPVPRSEVNELLPRMRLVVDAVMNEPYVVDENANVWLAVQEFACPRFNVAVMVPDEVIGVEPMVSVLFESDRPTEVTAPSDEAVRQFPPTA